MEDLYVDPRVNPEWVAGAWPDAFHAFEEAERVLIVAVLGAHELLDTVHREAARLGVDIAQGAKIEDVEMTQEQVDALSPYYARGEMARIAIEREFPELRASTLIAMYSALDAFVESVATSFLSLGPNGKPATDGGPTTRDVLKAMRKAIRDAKKESEPLGVAADEHLQAVSAAIAARPGGTGVSRWDQILRFMWMGNRGRRTPPDLDQALQEFAAIRNAFIHRHGRADARLLQDAPSLTGRYEIGDVIRIKADEYRVYSAALWTMLEDFRTRIAMSAGAAPDDSLESWRDNRSIGL